MSHHRVGNRCKSLSGSALIDELQDLLSDGQGGWWTEVHQLLFIIFILITPQQTLKYIRTPRKKKKQNKRHFTLTFVSFAQCTVFCLCLLKLNTILSLAVLRSWLRFPSGLSASTSMTDDASVLLLPAEAKLSARHSSPSLSACCRNKTAHMQNL